MLLVRSGHALAERRGTRWHLPLGIVSGVKDGIVNMGEYMMHDYTL